MRDWRAIKAHIEALIVHRLTAIAAGSARPGGRDRDELAFAQTGDARAESCDMAGDLMAEDHRLLQPHVAETAIVEIVKIGTADAACGERDLHLARAGRLFGAILDPQIPGGMDDDALHDVLSTGRRRPPPPRPTGRRHARCLRGLPTSHPFRPFARPFQVLYAIELIKQGPSGSPRGASSMLELGLKGRGTSSRQLFGGRPRASALFREPCAVGAPRALGQLCYR